MVVAIRVRVCSTVIPRSIWGRIRFDIEKLSVVCMYYCLNMLTVVCYGILKVEIEPSMVVRL
jgi:hypothetical protein